MKQTLTEIKSTIIPNLDPNKSIIFLIAEKIIYTKSMDLLLSCFKSFSFLTLTAYLVYIVVSSRKKKKKKLEKSKFSKHIMSLEKTLDKIYMEVGKRGT